MTPSALLEDLDIPAHARGRHITLNLYDELSRFLPQRPGAYLRISSDRFGLEAGVDRQLEDAEDTRKRLGRGPFARVYKENDTSAFKKRKVVRPDGTIDWVVLRPQFRALLADLAAGAIDGIVFYDLDRLVRQPRDLEDLIDVVEYVKRPAVGSTGGRMNLINDNDRHMARMMCVMALKSSEDTARRVARQHLACARSGGIQGPRHPKGPPMTVDRTPLERAELAGLLTSAAQSISSILSTEYPAQPARSYLRAVLGVLSAGPRVVGELTDRLEALFAEPLPASSAGLFTLASYASALGFSAVRAVSWRSPRERGCSVLLEEGKAESVKGLALVRTSWQTRPADQRQALAETAGACRVPAVVSRNRPAPPCTLSNPTAHRRSSHAPSTAFR